MASRTFSWGRGSEYPLLRTGTSGRRGPGRKKTLASKDPNPTAAPVPSSRPSWAPSTLPFSLHQDYQLILKIQLFQLGWTSIRLRPLEQFGAWFGTVEQLTESER